MSTVFIAHPPGGDGGWQTVEDDGKFICHKVPLGLLSTGNPQSGFR